jgi:DNA-binding transcriptional MerR regulator
VDATTKKSTTCKVGELAEVTGLTVRTLRYYEEIGLLVSTARSEGGHRLYGAAEVERLYRISLLRRLGLPLSQIGRALDDPAWSFHAAMSNHLAVLERRIEASGQLRNTLIRLMTAMGAGESLSTADLLTLLEEMTMTDTNVQRRISNLVYEDLDTAYEFLTRVFQLGPGELTRDEDGKAIHGEIEAGDGVVWLHPESLDSGLPHRERWAARRRAWSSSSTTSTPTFVMRPSTTPSSDMSQLTSRTATGSTGPKTARAASGRS